MTKEYTPEVKQRARELRDEGVPRSLIGTQLKQQCGLKRTPDTRTWERWLETAIDCKDQVVQDNPVSNGGNPADTYDFGDIPEMEWNLDELHRRQVPTKEARKLLETYYSLVNAPSRSFTPLKADPLYPALCFEVKLFQEYPNIKAQRVHELARMYYLGHWLAPRHVIDEALAAESREPRSSWIDRLLRRPSYSNASGIPDAR